MSAPGRVRVVRRPGWPDDDFRVLSAECREHGRIGPYLYAVQTGLPWARGIVTEHLRTEHPDLFQRCEECEGSGRWAHYPAGPMWGPEILGCPECWGNGWIFTDERTSA